MRFISGCLLVLLVIASSDAAVLVRFINTVPQRLDKVPLVGDRTNGWEAVGVNGAASRYNEAVDRVGLQYFPSQSSRTLVWTELVDDSRTDVSATAATAPYAYTFAMPPLRGAHKFKEAAQKTTDIDGVATYLKTQHTNNNENNDPTICSLYEQTTLKADGVSGYLSFAAGTYRMSAYGVLGVAAVADINSQPRFDYADSTFTFEDNKVYTLIAYGNGALAATPVGSGNTVKLGLITESVAPADFGMASIRFFHAIERASAVSISISNSGSAIANSISFGSVSDYTSIKATKSVHFSVIRSDTPTKDETDVTQVHDLRAGLRATLICAVNSLEVPSVFCRMIPSRVVAYVRLVNDVADKQQLIQGKFGPQKLSETKLTLWASFEYPRPEDTQAWTQDMGDVMITGHPLTSRGLYPVVAGVGANTVSGYGEVHVPVFIMDFAVRYVIGYSTFSVTAAGAAKNNMANRVDPSDNWFHYAPIFKRVSFVIKTDGYATVAGDKGTTLAFGGVDAGATGIYHAGTFTSGTNSLTNSLFTDMYVEPGEFYTVFAIANTRATHLLRLQSDAMIRIEMRRDMSVDDVHNDLLASSGSITFVPFARRIGGNAATTQLFDNGGNAINIAGPGSAGTTQQRTWGNNAVEVRDPAINNVLTTAQTGWPASQRALQLTAGTYTYSQVTNTGACATTLPSGSFTINNGERTEIFVLNTEGCVNNGGSISSLVTVTTKWQSATATGHAPSVSSVASREVRDIPFYSAASSSASMSMVLFVAAALLAAVFAF